MTIGVGILCQDGIVLGTDTQYTAGGLIKTFGPKLFEATKRSDVVVIIAGAGTVSFMKTASEKIGLEVDRLPTNPSASNVRDAIEKALVYFYTKHIYPAPQNIRPDFELLIGAWAIDGLHLYKSALTNLTPVTDFDFVKIGEIVAGYALELICGPGVGVEQAKFAAAHCIKAAKDYTEACGKTTHIWTLSSKGSIQRATTQETTELEKFSEDLTDALRLLGVGLDVEDLDEATINMLVDEIRNALVKVKDKQKKRKEIRERRASNRKQSMPP